MGITSAWGISPHDDSVISALEPRMRPLIESVRALPESRERWQRWAAEPLPDWRGWYGRGGGAGRAAMPERERERIDALIDSFHDLTRAGPFDEFYDGRDDDDDFSILNDVWSDDFGELVPFLAVHSKDYAVPALFHAIGSRRAALIPGWIGNFVLSAEQVRQSLPQIEAAFSFTAKQRAAAEDQLWLDERPGEESVLDGPLRCWREAAAHGLGLCGAAVHVW
ncbi:hypothetical protein [Streptomyces sp. GS7]|uniref:hypothetical protein n=1 Tax=Streptomyces sp. GS7 TaxID=2692234 RepID=UPI0013190BEE|nr:hypothetical protein [Streptomyces sp. GS7]QHC21726.1 hypothetical protein GR130_10135 [Streptomyces sp. GS7]